MDSYEVMHTIANLDFVNYTYYYVLVDGAATIQGQAITTTGPIMIPLCVGKTGQVVGAGVLGLFGKKKPEDTRVLNTDGSWSIKG